MEIFVDSLIRIRKMNHNWFIAWSFIVLNHDALSSMYLFDEYFAWVSASSVLLVNEVFNTFLGDACLAIINRSVAWHVYKPLSYFSHFYAKAQLADKSGILEGHSKR